MNSDGTTILLTTRYLDEAERLAHRLAVIEGGQVLDTGSPASIGGRSQAAARVRWLDVDGPREERTTEPTKLIAGLAMRFEGEIPQLVVERPSLEDVYVRMIERSRTAQ
jgi:ABC-2 type transport system ATP-binding protein